MGVRDDLGFEQDLVDKLLPLATPFYDYYWRVEPDGLANIPADGPVLLVANHSGILPFDAVMVKYAVYTNVPNRHLWVLMDRFVTRLPFLNVLFRKTGQVLACTENTQYLLDHGEAVLVFPEGVKGIAKPYSLRYKLRRFGRGGFVRMARKAAAPIVPVAVVGAEDIYRLVAKLEWPFKYLGIPFLPVTDTFPILGPLGVIPRPTKWRIKFLPQVTEHLAIAPGPDEDLKIQEIADSIRASIQSTIAEVLRKRRSVYL